MGKTLFSILVAIMVMLSIRWVGLLIINSLMILPAAAARLVARNLRQYTAGAIIVSVFSGISGLFLSYYAGTSSGATIVLIAAFVYLLLFLVTIVRSTR
jgi:zinc transport system permease protein